jgi:hypothetical protein
MQTVGRGAQFEVVTDGDYVYKTLHTVERSAAIYRSWGYGLITRDLEKLASDTLDHAKLSIEGVRSALESHPELAPTFANPVIGENLNYRQDKVTVMGEALRQATPARARQYIDEYIDLLLFHAGYGLADPILQMGHNYGVDKDDRVVLIDIGELTFDKETAIRAAATKAWRKANTYYLPFRHRYAAYIIPVSLKPYYRRQMLTRFTPKAIETNWLKATSSGDDRT